LASHLKENMPFRRAILVGHEPTQTIGDQVLPFDDRTVALEILRAVQ